MADLINVAVLISAGQHPVSSDPFLSRQEIGAISLAKGLANAAVRYVHGGSENSEFFKEVAGYDVSELDVIQMAPNVDPLQDIVDYIIESKIDLVLCGERASSGVQSGVFPYRLARRLGFTLLPAARELAVEGADVSIKRGLPGGRRHTLSCKFPAVVTVSDTTETSLAYSYARSKRGTQNFCVGQSTDEVRPPEFLPARIRPSYISVPNGATVEQRLKSILEGTATSSRVVQEQDAEKSAGEILEWLDEYGLLQRERRT